MHGVVPQWRLLLWKNFILKKRSLWNTFSEILAPVVIFALLCIIRTQVQVVSVPQSSNNVNDANTLDVPARIVNLVYTMGCGLHYSSSMQNPYTGLHGGAPNQSLAFAPQHPEELDQVQALMTSIQARVQSFLLSRAIPATVPCAYGSGTQTLDIESYVSHGLFRLFKSQSELQDYYTSKKYGTSEAFPPVYMSIVVQSIDALKGWDYTIGLNVSNAPWAGQITNDLQVGFESSTWAQYWSNGFLSVQRLVDLFILEQAAETVGGPAMPDFNVYVVPFPTGAHQQDDFAAFLASGIGLLLVMAFYWPFSRLVKSVVTEKEHKLQEGMQMMGLHESAFWCSWVLTFSLSLLCSVVLILILTKGLFAVFPYSESSLLLVLLMGYGLSTIAMGCWLSTMFSFAKSAGRVAPVVMIAAWLPYISLDNQQLSASVKRLACLLPPTAISFGGVILLDYESAFIGLRWDNLATPVNGFSMLDVIGMLYLDCLVYAALAWYFDNVFPREFGANRPWYFLFTKSYWLQNCYSQTNSPSSSFGAIPLLASATADNADQPQRDGEWPREQFLATSNIDIQFEPVPESLAQQAGVRIRGLRKEFSVSSSLLPIFDRSVESQIVAAVEGLDLDMYEGQIFALLGHNGAGKTTTINMLTGLLTPTSGDAWLFGASVVQQLPRVRTMIGVCPQHNVLFDTLTVAEHLHFFAQLKGVSAQTRKQAVATAIAEVQLQAKKDAQACTLSGGQKRRLSLAIALIGDSKVVFLDEPTSGVDPASRRAIWDLLMRKKQGRVIVLTTHFMDEADQLGDRIGIIHHGHMKCVGSSLFLKNLYGVGYSMTCILESKGKEKRRGLAEMVKKHVPEARQATDVGAEMSFALPLRSSSAFPELLDEIEQQKSNLGLQSYGLSVTTLEEVFLKVASGAALDEASSNGNTAHSVNDGRVPHGAEGVVAGGIEQENGHTVVVNDKQSVLAGKRLLQAQGSGVDRSFSRHVRALLSKRFHHTKRDKQAWCCQYLLPFLLITLGLGILQFPLSGFFPYIELSTSQYNSPNYVAVAPAFEEALGSGFPQSSQAVLETAYNRDGSQIRSLHNFSTYLLDNANNNKQSRYGAYYQATDTAKCPLEEGCSFSVFTNLSAVHGLPTFLNLVDASMLRVITADPEATIRVGFKAFEPTYTESQAIEAVNGIFASIVISLAFSFIPASFAAFVVMEREYNSKHLQTVSGVRTLSYWLSMYLWDALNFIITGGLCALVVLLYNNPSFTEDGNFSLLCLLFLLYGLAVIPFTYCWTFAFRSASSAQGVMIMIYILGGIILVIVDFTLYIIPKTREANDKYIRYMFRILPNYCLGDAIFFMSVNGISGGLFADSNWNKEIAGWDVIFLAVQPVVYFLLTLALEFASHKNSWLYWCYNNISSNGQARSLVNDPDVLAERERVQTGHTCDDIIQIRGLRKVFPGGKEAVKDLWFGVPAGQCFGFLGVNGAGKTTALRMITGDEIPTAGTALLNGLDIASHGQEVRSMMGYCPQFDALHTNLTAVEHLEFYGRIRGVSERQLGPMVSYLIDRLNLREYADRLAGTYSGGNKRKLSVAIALVGDPPVVFLDEPSTGIDPVSRRFMWDFIGETMAERAVVLTTHSMEECEALCGRIAIIGSGELMCIGSSQHLKTRFGRGVQLEISTAGQPVEPAREFVLRSFRGAQEIECFGSKARFRIPQVIPSAGEEKTGEHILSLSNIFSLLEQKKALIGISEYAVGQTTLEQVFISLARQDDIRQEEARRAAPSRTSAPDRAGFRYQEI
eukprot:gb/GEZN01000227.1/.p1 GENE.gb/GEZN01000227.1/~~gb/GEZN01000227.1/.p1  ORF type:complete len:1777 (-),score=227.45 gb/GEZN01000227.1/:107-5437(-)